MNRLRSAEADLNSMIFSSKELVSIINVNRLRNLVTCVYLKVKWVKETRKKIEKAEAARQRKAIGHIKTGDSQGGLTSAHGSTSYVEKD